jgi:hypothetical protein
MSGGLWKKSQRSVSQTFADQKQKKKNDCNANSNKDKRESLITIQDFSAIKHPIYAELFPLLSFPNTS